MRFCKLFIFILLCYGVSLVQPAKQQSYCAACMDTEFLKVEHLYVNHQFKLFTKSIHRFLGLSCSERRHAVVRCNTSCIHAVVFHKNYKTSSVDDFHSYSCADNTKHRHSEHGSGGHGHSFNGTMVTLKFNENITMMFEFYNSTENITAAKNVVYRMAKERDERSPFHWVPWVGSIHIHHIQLVTLVVVLLNVIAFAVLITLIIKLNVVARLRKYFRKRFARKSHNDSSYVSEPFVYSDLANRLEDDYGAAESVQHNLLED